MANRIEELRQYIGNQKIVSPFDIQHKFDWARSKKPYKETDCWINLDGLLEPEVRYTGFSEEFAEIWMKQPEELNLCILTYPLDGVTVWGIALKDQAEAMIGEPDHTVQIEGGCVQVYFDITEELPKEWQDRMTDVVEDTLHRTSQQIRSKDFPVGEDKPLVNILYRDDEQASALKVNMNVNTFFPSDDFR